MNMKTKKNKSNIKIHNHISSKTMSSEIAIQKPYVVAIPSYRRPELIARATLWTLYRGNIPSSRITVFLASLDERRLYTNILQNPINSEGQLMAILPKHIQPDHISRYAKWLLGVTLVIGKKGLANQRNFITQWYPTGQHILNMDDDVRNIMRLRVAKGNVRDRRYWTLKPVIGDNNLDMLIQSGFKKAVAAGAYLWGIYPVDNAYFMQPNSSTRLKFIVGPMFGIINRPELAEKLDITMDEKEDMERTLRFWKQDGAIVRLNYVTVETAYYDNSGGMQASLDMPLEHRKRAASESAERLHKMYPNLTRLYYRKTGPRKGWAEIKLVGSRPQRLTQKTPSTDVGDSQADKYKKGTV